MPSISASSLEHSTFVDQDSHLAADRFLPANGIHSFAGLGLDVDCIDIHFQQVRQVLANAFLHRTELRLLSKEAGVTILESRISIRVGIADISQTGGP